MINTHVLGIEVRTEADVVLIYRELEDERLPSLQSHRVLEVFPSQNGLRQLFPPEDRTLRVVHREHGGRVGLVLNYVGRETHRYTRE